MKKIIKPTLLLILIGGSFAHADTEFDYYEFMNKEKAVEKNEGWFSFDWFDKKEDGEEEEKGKTYSERKYGRTLKYKTYEEIKADRKRKNTLLMLGAEYREIKFSEKIWDYNYTTGQKTEVIDLVETTEPEWSTTLYMSTLLDLKYFNIQQEKKNTYLGVSLGKYIDMDVQMDFTDGRATDFYAMAGPFLRINLKDQERLISAGLQGTVGFFFTDNIGLFYTAKLGTDTFISEDENYLIEKTGISEMVEQAIFISIKF